MKIKKQTLLKALLLLFLVTTDVTFIIRIGGSAFNIATDPGTISLKL